MATEDSFIFHHYGANCAGKSWTVNLMRLFPVHQEVSLTDCGGSAINPSIIFAHMTQGLHMAAPHDTVTPMLQGRSGIGLVMSAAWFPSNLTPAIHAKEFNLCLIRPDYFVSNSLSPPGGLPCVFYQEVASVWPLYHTILIGGLLQIWLSI